MRFRASIWKRCTCWASLIVATVIIHVAIDPYCAMSMDDAPHRLSVIVEFDLRTLSTRILNGTGGTYISIVAMTPDVICLRRAGFDRRRQSSFLDTGNYLYGISVSDGKVLWSMASDERTYSRRMVRTTHPWLPRGEQNVDLIPPIQTTNRESFFLFTADHVEKTITRSLVSVRASDGHINWKREVIKCQAKENSPEISGPYCVDDWVVSNSRDFMDRSTGRDLPRLPYSYRRLTRNQDFLIGWEAGFDSIRIGKDTPGQVWTLRRGQKNDAMRAPVPVDEELLGVSATRMVFLRKWGTLGQKQLISRDSNVPEKIVGRSEEIREFYLDTTAISGDERRVYFGSDKLTGVNLETGQFLFIHNLKEPEAPVLVDGNLLYTVCEGGIMTRNATTGLEPKLLWSGEQIRECIIPGLRPGRFNTSPAHIIPSEWVKCMVDPFVLMNQKLYFVVHGGGEVPD